MLLSQFNIVHTGDRYNGYDADLLRTTGPWVIVHCTIYSLHIFFDSRCRCICSSDI